MLKFCLCLSLLVFLGCCSQGTVQLRAFLLSKETVIWNDSLKILENSPKHLRFSHKIGKSMSWSHNIFSANFSCFSEVCEEGQTEVISGVSLAGYQMECSGEKCMCVCWAVSLDLSCILFLLQCRSWWMELQSGSSCGTLLAR